ASRDAVRIDAEGGGDVGRAGAVVEERAGEGAGVAGLVVGAANDRSVVAGDGVVAGVAVDAVAGVGAAGDVVAADQVVVVVAAGDLVGALSADGGVVAGVAGDDVSAAAVGGGGEG